MNPKTSLDYTPLWEYSAPPHKVTLKHVFKALIYFLGIFLTECSVLGIAFTIFGTTSSRSTWITLLIVFGTFSGSLIYFFQKKFKARCLTWSQYFWLILGDTISTFILVVIEAAFVPNPQDKTLPPAIFGGIILFYSTILTGIAHLQPSFHQQVGESTRGILKAMPGRQLALSELIARLKKQYKYSEIILCQQIISLTYLELIDIPGTNIKVCRIKGTKISLAFPQVTNITTYDLKQKVIRALTFLNDENVDLGLFLLSKEFEATLKIYLLSANTKGKLHIPVKSPPDSWKLDQMIDWVRKNNIIVDYAVLNYLRQTRNDRAHGKIPSPAEKRALMLGIQYLADLYIDYIILLDDLTAHL